MARPEGTAGEMLADVVGALVVRIDAMVPAALADEPDAVHQLRTAVRRLRNVLAAFSAYVEPAAVGGLRARLAEYGDQLGHARDLEVRAEWCARLAAEVGLDDDLRDALLTPLRAQHDHAHAALAAWMASPAAEQLRSSLCAFADAPELANGSARPASVAAREVLAAQVGAVLAHRTDYREEPDAAHALRKAARRLRHTADAVTKPPAAVLGRDAAAAGELGSRLQSLLGDHRDALLLVGHVRRSVPDPAMRTSYDGMVEAARHAAATALAAVPAALADLASLSDAGDRVGGWTSGSAS